MPQILNNAIRFLRNPSENKKGNSLLQDFILFIAVFSLNLIGVTVKIFFTEEVIVDDSDFKLLTSSKLFSLILLVPLIEEFTFRGFLNFKNRYIYILSVLALLFFCFSFIKQEEIQLVICSIFLSLSILVYFYKELYIKMLKFISKHIFILAIVSSVAFGIIHISNYSEFGLVDIFTILQKIIGGLFLAYIAYKYNIWLSYFFHIINNIIPFTIIYITSIAS